MTSAEPVRLFQGDITTLSGYPRSPARVSTLLQGSDKATPPFTNSHSVLVKTNASSCSSITDISGSNNTDTLLRLTHENTCNTIERSLPTHLTNLSPLTPDSRTRYANRPSPSLPLHQSTASAVRTENFHESFLSPPSSPLTPASLSSSALSSSSSTSPDEDFYISDNDPNDSTTCAWENIRPSIILSHPMFETLFRDSVSGSDINSDSNISSSDNEAFTCSVMDVQEPTCEDMDVKPKHLSYLDDLNGNDYYNNINININYHHHHQTFMDFLKKEESDCFIRDVPRKTYLSPFQPYGDEDSTLKNFTDLHPIGITEMITDNCVEFDTDRPFFIDPNSPPSSSTDYEQIDLTSIPDSDNIYGRNNSVSENNTFPSYASGEQSPDSSDGIENNLPVFQKIVDNPQTLEDPLPHKQIASCPKQKQRKRAKSSPQTSERRKPGRKPGQISNVLHLWEFMRDLLYDPETNRKIVEWISKADGVFRVVNSSEVARLWGLKKNNKKEMTYEKLSRSLRYSRDEGYFVNVPRDKNYPRKLCFKFGPKSKDWSRPHSF